MKALNQGKSSPIREISGNLVCKNLWPLCGIIRHKSSVISKKMIINRNLHKYQWLCFNRNLIRDTPGVNAWLLLMFVTRHHAKHVLNFLGAIARLVAMTLGNQEAPRSIHVSRTSFHEDLVMKLFLQPFFLFR